MKLLIVVAASMLSAVLIVPTVSPDQVSAPASILA